MNKLLLTLLLILVNTSAMAEWSVLSQDDSGIGITVYVDLATIRKSGDKIKMWGLTDYKSAMESAEGRYLSKKSRWEYDCKEEQMRLLAMSTYSENMGSGKILFLGSALLVWDPVVPGSIEEKFWRAACDK